MQLNGKKQSSSDDSVDDTVADDEDAIDSPKTFFKRYGHGHSHGNDKMNTNSVSELKIDENLVGESMDEWAMNYL